MKLISLTKVKRFNLDYTFFFNYVLVIVRIFSKKISKLNCQLLKLFTNPIIGSTIYNNNNNIQNVNLNIVFKKIFNIF